MSEPRHLVVNADDLGLCEAVNAGIARAHADGIVTSASLMVRQAAAPGAAEIARELPRLAIGLHLDLDQRDYASGGPVAAEHRFDPADAGAVAAECRAQLQRFRELLGRDPTHLDSHHHVHMSAPVGEVAASLAAELAVPLRGRRIPYEGGFFGRTSAGASAPELVAPERLVALIRSLPPGWTEIGCHPAAGPVPSSSYDAERRAELRTLCDPAVKRAVREEGIELRSMAAA